MISIFQALVLGVLQGLSEFLPVSSSAHLSIAPWFFGWTSPGLAFDVALHVGTLVAVIWYFRAEWVRLLRATREIVTTRRVDTAVQRRIPLLVVATIPAVIAGFLLDDIIEHALRSPLVTASTLIILGLILWIVDRKVDAKRHVDQLGYRDALLIGCAQMLALVPGVSRSGSTITAGRALGLNRNDAAFFSFLMSMPVIAGAAVLKVPELLANGGLTTSLLVGVAASAISGFAAIAILMRYVRTRSFGIFAAYRIALGLVIFALYFIRG